MKKDFLYNKEITMKNTSVIGSEIAIPNTNCIDLPLSNAWKNTNNLKKSIAICCLVVTGAITGILASSSSKDSQDEWDTQEPSGPCTYYANPDGTYTKRCHDLWYLDWL